VFVTRLNTVVVDPRDGTVLLKFPFGRRGPTVNAAMPLVFGDRLFVTASYGIGARLVRLRGEQLETVWENDDSLSSQYPTPIYHDGYLYGIHGREDVGVAELRCVDAGSGKLMWSVPGFGMAHTIRAGNRLLLLAVDGRLLLTEASPEGFRTIASGRVSDLVTRALPALVEGYLYFRENGYGGGAVKCVALATP
jgi:hypothetical protein